MIEFHSAIFFAWVLCAFGPPSRALVPYHMERGGMLLQLMRCVSTVEKGEGTDINANAGA